METNSEGYGSPVQSIRSATLMVNDGILTATPHGFCWRIISSSLLTALSIFIFITKLIRKLLSME